MAAPSALPPAGTALPGAEPAASPRPDLRQWVLCVLWPSFLMAGVTEMLVFAVVDPGDLTWFGGAAIDWPRQAIYTVSFFIFWAVTAVACGLTALLSLGAPDLNRGAGAAGGP